MNRENRSYYILCCVLAILLAVIMIYREIPAGSEPASVRDKLVNSPVTAVYTMCSETVSKTGKLFPDETFTATEASQVTEESDENGITPVNINTADLSLLMTLKGIGEKKARSIIEYREQNGRFKSTDELCNVAGIGQKTLDGITDFITAE